MKLFSGIFFSVFLFLLNVQLTKTSPITEPDAEAVIPKDFKSPDGNAPDISKMLDIFHNGFNIDDIGTLAKEFKFIMDLIQSVMTINPVIRGIVNAAAEKNIELRILLKLSSGKYPDLKDMFELATGNQGNMADDLNAEAKQNKIEKLVGKPPTDYVTVLQLLTKMDYSSFPTNVQPNKNMATDDHEPRPDPEIQGFLHDVKVRNPQILRPPNAKAEAEAMVTSELGSFLNIFSATLNLLKPNEETGKSDMAGNAGQK